MKAALALIALLALASPATARVHHGGGLETVRTAAGPITVAADAAPRFVSLIGDLVRHGYRGWVHCFDAHGHMPHSLHHSGRACDFAQRGRNRTTRIMYHAHAIIAAHGLRDGCSFRDCGHVDTGQPTGRRALAYARHRHRNRYAGYLDGGYGYEPQWRYAAAQPAWWDSRRAY
jgi:hypothetical protein